MRTYAEALAEYDEECERIAEECAAEGYPSHGSNYDLRVEQLREYYPEIFGECDENE
jgi:hypothetical protein